MEMYNQETLFITAIVQMALASLQDRTHTANKSSLTFIRHGKAKKKLRQYSPNGKNFLADSTTEEAGFMSITWRSFPSSPDDLPSSFIEINGK